MLDDRSWPRSGAGPDAPGIALHQTPPVINMSDGGAPADISPGQLAIDPTARCTIKGIEACHCLN